MVIDWQDLAALIMVAAAAAWLARGIWRWLWRKGSPGCPSCTGCADRGASEAAKLIEIQPVAKS